MWSGGSTRALTSAPRRPAELLGCLWLERALKFSPLGPSMTIHKVLDVDLGPIKRRCGVDVRRGTCFNRLKLPAGRIRYSRAM